MVLIVSFLKIDDQKMKLRFSKSKMGTGRFGKGSVDLAGKCREVGDGQGSLICTGDDQNR